MIDSAMHFRFAAVISHPIQHYAPIFRELARVPGVRVKVFYGCDHGIREFYDPGFGTKIAWDIPLLDGYEHEFLPVRRQPRHQGFWEIDSPHLTKRLEAFAPHAMWVHGYGHLLCCRAVLWARRRCAVLHFGDSELLHRRPLLVRLSKYILLRTYFDWCDAFITVGDNNEDYYRHYGVPGDKMFRGACPVDFGRFRRALADDRQSRARIRERFGIAEDAIVVMSSGKLQAIKRPCDLVEAVGILKQRGIEVHAVFVGDGPSRAEVERRIREHGVEDRVKITGFVNQREIPMVLEIGDMLAVTSQQDAHPLSVSESLIMGHPIVASDRVGCVGPTDTARPGVNALVYRCGDVTALADAIARLVQDEPLRLRMGAESRKIAPTQDVDTAVLAVLRALKELYPRFADSWRDAFGELGRYLEGNR